MPRCALSAATETKLTNNPLAKLRRDGGRAAAVTVIRFFGVPCGDAVESVAADFPTWGLFLHVLHFGGYGPP